MVPRKSSSHIGPKRKLGPPLLSLATLQRECNAHRPRYARLIEAARPRLLAKSRELAVIIPVRGRHQQVRPCVTSLQRSAAAAGLSISIMIVENDAKRHLESSTRQLGTEYLFLPKTSSKHGHMAKSLCYNTAFLLLRPTKWVMFHDIDMLVDLSFFSNLSTYTATNPSWIQPYTQKRVMLLPQSTTNAIQSSEDPPTAEQLATAVPADAGSTGGSVVVRGDVAQAVGCYDPELFYGWGPEDAFFWAKLEVYAGAAAHRDQWQANRGHMGGAVYANNPPIEMYHLWHPPANPKGRDSRLDKQNHYLASFYGLPRRDQIELIKLKEGALCRSR